jgi:hypothetical protein
MIDHVVRAPCEAVRWGRLRYSARHSRGLAGTCSFSCSRSGCFLIDGSLMTGPGPASLCEIRRQQSERHCDDEIVMAASGLQSEPGSRAWLEDELSKLFAQEVAAGRMLRDRQLSTPHHRAEPLDQPRLADDQAIAEGRAGEWALAADEADTDMRRGGRQQFRGGVAEAALVENEEVEPSEVRRNQSELLAQRSLRKAHCCSDGEPVRLDVEEHERAVVASAREIEAGNQLQRRQAHETSGDEAMMFC